MQNPKTGGNRFNPDIRPSEIDTYTETNGEQTAEYKIINAHPIIGGILNKLAFFRTHAAAVYYNRLANKTVKQKFDDVDEAVSELNEKLGTKKVFKTYFVGSDKSLWNVFKEILSSSDSFSTIIFNQPQENVFSEKGLESGVLTVYYSVSYWANHLMYCLQAGTSVYTGIINAKDNQIMSFAQQITKDYVDDKIKIIESAEITLNTSTTISYTLYSLPVPSGYRMVSREFIRLDTGTYNVLIFLPLNHSYIVHMSTGAHTIKGKVLGLCVKS